MFQGWTEFQSWSICSRPGAYGQGLEHTFQAWNFCSTPRTVEQISAASEPVICSTQTSFCFTGVNQRPPRWSPNLFHEAQFCSTPQRWNKYLFHETTFVPRPTAWNKYSVPSNHISVPRENTFVPCEQILFHQRKSSILRNKLCVQ